MLKNGAYCEVVSLESPPILIELSWLITTGHERICTVIQNASRSKDGKLLCDACLVFFKLHFPLDQQRANDQQRAGYRRVMEYLERLSALVV